MPSASRSSADDRAVRRRLAARVAREMADRRDTSVRPGVRAAADRLRELAEDRERRFTRPAKTA